jgi:hypothetical protein
MGYFSNGSEGMRYEDEYCAHCIHGNTEDGCPVWWLHALYNYSQCEDSDRGHVMFGEILDILIPRSQNKLFNDRCAMFHEDGR